MGSLCKINESKEISQLLRNWRNAMHPSEQNLISRYLGHLAYLNDIKPDETIINALVQVWDPEHSVFKFGDYELTATPEEIAGFLGLSLKGKGLIFLTTSGRRELSIFTGVKESALSRPIQENSIEIKRLYNYFASKESFAAKQRDFFITTEDAWSQRRVWVYGLVLAGIFIFPRPDDKVNIRVVKMMSDLFHGVEGRDLTIVPTIIADIFIACTKCKKKSGYFYGPSIVLQVWAIEHLKRRSIVQSRLVLRDINWVQSHNRRIDQTNKSKDIEGYLEFFRMLTKEHICWVLDWTECHEPALQCFRRKFIPLLGSNRIVPYIPQKVLYQFGRIQGIPPELQIDEFNLVFQHGVCPEHIPKKSEIAEAWGSRCTNKNILFDSETKFIPRTTVAYDACLKDFSAWKRQAIVNPTKEINRLRALLDAKDRELIQEKQVSKRYKEAYESLKELYTEAKQNQRERKRKYLELTDDINHLMNRYSWESDSGKAQRYEGQLKKVLDRMGELTK